MLKPEECKCCDGPVLKKSDEGFALQLSKHLTECSVGLFSQRTLRKNSSVFSFAGHKR